MSARATYESALLDLARSDERVVVLTAENRAALRALPGLLGPSFLYFGVADQTMVGAAAGLDMRGRVPLVHALAAFLTMRPFEFVRTDVGIPSLPVKLVGYVPGFLSEANGPTHQALEDVALMRGIPGMRVFAPGDEEDLLLGLPAVLSDPRPWYVRFNARETPVAHAPFEIGRAERLSEGDDVAVLTYGTLLTEAVAASRLLEGEGLSVSLFNLRTLAPLDSEAVASAARTARLLVTLEDHFEAGGLSTLVAEVCLRLRLAPRHLPIALRDRWFVPALFPDVLETEGFTPEAIAARITTALEEASR